jgi:hypothetical protein
METHVSTRVDVLTPIRGGDKRMTSIMGSLLRPWNWPGRVKVNFALGLGILLAISFLPVFRVPEAKMFIGMGLVLAGGLLSAVVVRIVVLDETPIGHQEKTIRMMRGAHVRIIATCGTLDENAWVNWDEGAVPLLLREKVAQGVIIEIVCRRIDARIVPTLIILCKEFPEQVRIYVNEAVDPMPHSVLVDSRALRLMDTYIRNPTIGAAVFLEGFEEYRRESMLLAGKQPV